jgi:ATP-dependent DNA helicase DinG
LQEFWQGLQDDNHLIWATRDREYGQFTLHLSPVEVAQQLQPLWETAPVVLMGGFLDSDKTAPTYRHQIGLGDTLCLQFSPTRQTEAIQLYLPDRLPLPNTPEFKGAMLEEIHALTQHYLSEAGTIAILVDDVPLKAQIASYLAGQFGSQVKVEKPLLRGILVCGWDYWQQHQHQYPPPCLLIVVALPIPSLEHPLVSERVAYFKRQRKDWFRLYLLPTALRSLQQAVMPLRETQSMVAVLDSRVNTRSYGTRILQALEPYARVNYLEEGLWMEQQWG